MDIRQLNYFVEVAKHLSFSKAAETLHISQPSLSKMVKNLEDELGVILLERTTKHMSLTDAGEIVLGEAQEIIKLMQNMSSKLSDLMQMKQGNIKVGLPPVIGSLFFPKLIRDFHTQYPQIKIQFVEEGAKKVERLIEEGSLDFGLAVLPVDHDLFDICPLVNRELKCIVYPEHPLSKHTIISLDQLKNEPFILLQEDFALHDQIREQCIRSGFEPMVTYESSQWDFICEMVANQHGISILPEPLCRKLDPTKIKTLSIVEPHMPWNLAMIWRKNKYMSYATRELVSFISRNFSITDNV